MSGNVSGSWGEKSFFGDSSFHNGETNKTNKEFSKNSSNPEINKEEQDFINKIERKATVTIVRDKGFKNNKPKN